MKKKTAMMVAALVLAVFALAACSKMTMLQYAEKNMPQSEVDQINESFGGLLTLAVETTDNELIFNYTFSEEVPVDSLDEATVESAFADQQPMMKQLYDDIKKEVDAQNPVVLFKVFDSQGNEIYSKLIA